MTPQQRQTSRAAMSAYNAMETTKKRHMTLLQAITTREKKFGLQASALETDLLDTLLADHNDEVKSFQTAMQNLKQQYPDAMQAMLAHITHIEQGLAPFVEE